MANYEVEILVNGRSIRQFNHKGNVFVEGRKGSNFELKFMNNTWDRVEVVPSVDGLSVIDGEPCGVESSGYLVPSRSHIVIPGWRLDNDSIAKFVFKGKNKSYSAKSGQGTDNVGAIGFMVFREKTNYSVYPAWPIFRTTEVHHHHHYRDLFPFWTTYGGSSDSTLAKIGSNAISNNIPEINQTIATSAQSATVRGATVFSANSESDKDTDETWNLGVGFGDENNHFVQEVAFTRENPTVPDSILTVYYDSKKGLEARGIQLVRSRKGPISELPNPFPTYSGTGCKPPPGWRGRK